MRRSLSVVFVAVGVAGWLGVACGSEAKQGAGFKCGDVAIAHGQTTQCDSSGQFDEGSAYRCGPLDNSSPKALHIQAGTTTLGNGGLCPTGTGLVPDFLGSSGVASGASSSGGSSSGGSSSGGSSSGDVGSSSGGSSSGGSSSGGLSSDNGTSSSGGSSSGNVGSSSGGSGSEGEGEPSCESGYKCTPRGNSTRCVCTTCDEGYETVKGACVRKGNNGVGNGYDPQPPGNPPINDGPGTSPGDPGNKGGAK